MITCCNLMNSDARQNRKQAGAVKNSVNNAMMLNCVKNMPICPLQKVLIYGFSQKNIKNIFTFKFKLFFSHFSAIDIYTANPKKVLFVISFKVNLIYIIDL